MHAWLNQPDQTFLVVDQTRLNQTLNLCRRRIKFPVKNKIGVLHAHREVNTDKMINRKLTIHQLIICLLLQYVPKPSASSKLNHAGIGTRV